MNNNNNKSARAMCFNRSKSSNVPKEPMENGFVNSSTTGRKKHSHYQNNRQKQQRHESAAATSSALPVPTSSAVDVSAASSTSSTHSAKSMASIPTTTKRQRMRSECNNNNNNYCNDAKKREAEVSNLNGSSNANYQQRHSISNRQNGAFQRGRNQQQRRRHNNNMTRGFFHSSSKAPIDNEDNRMEVDCREIHSNNSLKNFVSQTQIRSAELSDLPGFSYDPATKKYYRILENQPGQPAGSTLRHLRNLAVQTAEVGSNTAFCARKPTKNSANLPALFQQLQLGGGGRAVAQHMERTIDERRLRSIKQRPSYSFEVADTWGQRYASCQFLDVSEDGRTLLGCWSTEQYDRIGGQCSRVLSFNISVDANEAKREAQKLYDGNHCKLMDSNGRYRCNTYGLRFEELDNGLCLDCLGTSNRILVDMVLAPADRDVTCLLFATAHSFYREQYANSAGCPKIVTKCTVNLRPIEFNLSEEGRESMSSPIYNAEWSYNEPIWSLCFNSYHMKICVGMEKCAKILNVLSGQHFCVSSGGRNVISCTFSKDGSQLLLGRKCANVSMLDMRMPSNHAVGELSDSLSTGYMHLLQTRPHTLVTENFEGKIKLWDVRGGTSRGPMAQMEAGHRNSSHKLPCFVDADERFVFAVGEDATVRGWSLHSGELLCSVTSPVSYQHQNRSHRQQIEMAIEDPKAGIDFPRVAFNSSWGGRTGNSALILAVNGDLIVHELLL